MAPFVAITETVGGALLVAGLTTRLGDGFFVDAGGGEFVLVLAGASLALVLTGAGRFSVNSAFDIPPRLWSRALRFRGVIPLPRQAKGTP